MKTTTDSEDWKELQARKEECLEHYFKNRPKYIEAAVGALNVLQRRGFKKDWDKRSCIALMDYLLTEEGRAKRAAANRKAAFEKRMKGQS